MARRRRGVLAAVSPLLKSLSVPEQWCLGRTELVPIQRQWLAPACNSQKGKQIALWSLSLLKASLFHASLAVPFFFLACVVPPTISKLLLRAITTGISEGGEGWGRLVVWLVRRLVENMCLRTYSPHPPLHAQSAAHQQRFVLNGSISLSLPVTSLSSLRGKVRRNKRCGTSPPICLPRLLCQRGSGLLVQTQEPQQGPRQHQRGAVDPMTSVS